jgi:hypothetical protein
MPAPRWFEIQTCVDNGEDWSPDLMGFFKDPADNHFEEVEDAEEFFDDACRHVRFRLDWDTTPDMFRIGLNIVPSMFEEL